MSLTFPSCFTQSHYCYFQSFHLPLFILPLCILRTFHVPIVIFCLQLRLSRCPLMRSSSKHPLGFIPAASLDPAARNSLSRSFPVAVESHSDLGVSPFATIVFSFSVMTVFLAP